MGLLPQQAFSPRLTQLICRVGTWVPFEQVPEALRFVSGASVSASRARHLTERAGSALVAVETAEAAQIERGCPAAPAGPAVQQLSADGAMVPLVGGEWAEVRTLAIGTVEQRLNRKGEQEAHCTDLSYFSRLADAETFIRLAVIATHKRGTERAGTVVGVMDGAVWLQRFLDVHRVDAVRILDFPHAAEYLADAAHAVFGTGTSAAAAWLTTQSHTLKHAGPDTVLAALRALPAVDEATVVRDRSVRYLEDRREQIAYPSFRASGYPIGSGSVESANKVVVEDRMKRSGCHWKRENVSPMVALRAMERSGDWGERWGVIWQRERTDATRPRVERYRIWAATEAKREAEEAARAPAAPGPQRLGVLDGPPTMVNGKPTKHHPWRR